MLFMKRQSYRLTVGLWAHTTLVFIEGSKLAKSV
jgi:hypothetical protein